MNKNLIKLFRALLLLVFSLAMGIVGYVSFEGYSLVDAFYMSVITISTVGYGAVDPLSEGGKVFTSIYIIVNLGIFAYVVSIFTTYLFEGELRVILRNFIQGREVKQLKNHTIVCGYGRNGSKACAELIKEKREFVLIESNEEMLQHFNNNGNFQSLVGDATTDEILKKAGIERASSIITTLPSDADNVFITLTARELNPSIKIIARASEESSEKKLSRAGATHVVMPDTLGGMHMAQLIAKPYVIEFLELLNGVGGENVVLDEFSFDELKNKYHQKSLAELDVRKNTGVTVIGLKEKKHGFMFNPHPGRMINQGDILIILGSQENIDQFKKRYSS